MRQLLFGLLVVVLVAGCGKAPENVENSDATAKFDPNDPATREPFVAVWNKKELERGYFKQQVTFLPSGRFRLEWDSRDSIQRANMFGPWKNLTQKKIEFNNENDVGNREKLTAVLLDPETLEIELNGKKSTYIREQSELSKNLKNRVPSKSDVPAEDAVAIAKALQKKRKFESAWKRYDDQKQIVETLQTKSDLTATFASTKGMRETTQTTWKILSDTRIEFNRPGETEGAEELYATGELLDDKKLRVTIAGEVFDFTRP